MSSEKKKLTTEEKKKLCPDCIIYRSFPSFKAGECESCIAEDDDVESAPANRSLDEILKVLKVTSNTVKGCGMLACAGGIDWAVDILENRDTEELGLCEGCEKMDRDQAYQLVADDPPIREI